MEQNSSNAIIPSPLKSTMSKTRDASSFARRKPCVRNPLQTRLCQLYHLHPHLICYTKRKRILPMCLICKTIANFVNIILLDSATCETANLCLALRYILKSVHFLSGDCKRKRILGTRRGNFAANENLY